jgi:hypothetical protein
MRPPDAPWYRPFVEWVLLHLANHFESGLFGSKHDRAAVDLRVRRLLLRHTADAYVVDLELEEAGWNGLQDGVAARVRDGTEHLVSLRESERARPEWQAGFRVPFGGVH